MGVRVLIRTDADDRSSETEALSGGAETRLALGVEFAFRAPTVRLWAFWDPPGGGVSVLPPPLSHLMPPQPFLPSEV